MVFSIIDKMITLPTSTPGYSIQGPLHCPGNYHGGARGDLCKININEHCDHNYNDDPGENVLGI